VRNQPPTNLHASVPRVRVLGAVETPPALARSPLIDHAQMAAYLEKYNPQNIATALGAATAGKCALHAMRLCIWM